MRESYQERLDECLCEHPHACVRVLSRAELEHSEELHCVCSRGCIGAGEEETARQVYSGCRHIAATYKPNIKCTTRCYTQTALQTGKSSRDTKRIVKYAVDAAKERWICKVAEEAERLKTDSRSRWTSIQQLQMTYAGQRPTRHPAIQKENAEIIRSSEEVKARWFEHFNRVLNVPSEFHLRNVFI